MAVGLAPQELNLDWFLTLEESLDYHGGYFGMSRKDRRERAHGAARGVLAARTRRTTGRGRCRGGMKRRLILARALMHRPKLLILDEPTAGVDVELRLELWHYVQRINAEGTTILLTTHYLEEAEQLCNKIAFINGGRDRGHGDVARAGGGVRRLEPGGRLPGARRPRRALARAHREDVA